MNHLHSDYLPRRYGPLKWFTLFSSGVNQKVLRRVSSETTIYSVIGTFVIITGCFAGVAAYNAISIRIYGDLRMDWMIVPWAAAWALLIYSVDRAIVRMPINPVRFRPEAVQVLWTPSATPEGDVVFAQRGSGKVIRTRWWDSAGVVASMLPRVLLAIAASFIFAETILLIVFQDSVQAQVEVMVSSAAAKNLDDANKQNQTLLDQLTKARDNLRAQLSPELPRLRNQLPEFQKDCTGYGANISKLTSAISSEYDGTGIVIDLYPSGQWHVGNQPASEQRVNRLRTEIDSQTGKRDNACTAASTTDAAIKNADIALDGNPEVASLNAKIAGVDSKLSDAQGQATAIADRLRNDIFVRFAAIEQLIQVQDVMSPTPSTTPSPAPSTSSGNPQDASSKAPEASANPKSPPSCGAWNVGCVIGQYFFYPSPMGPMVGAFRIVFLSMELMPIILKIGASLRRRRPYDTLMAATEHVSEGASVRLASQHLMRIGTLIERDAYERRQARSANGAEFVAATARVENMRRRAFGWPRRSPGGWGSSILWLLFPRDVRQEDLYRGPTKDPGGDETIN
ncbi:DUF4407 domain-containing protein [Arthrobacter sp. 2MCAF14]|uniref:DUF4407 domain-containing protein n=1 Tax=Arthrobacter sp. 2MCAF14 TaxID=3232982 RepID=UPI003F903BFC